MSDHNIQGELNKIFYFLSVLFFMIISCKKENNEMSDLQKVRNNNNKKTYPVTKMDSVQAISFITKQKIQAFAFIWN